MKKFAIIVAGGSGTRMKSEVPKQFMLLQGRPVLMHTLQRFFDEDPETVLILVLAANLRNEWEQLCQQFDFRLSHQLADGGETRFHSVKNGLSLVPEQVLVAVHDAARPLVSIDTIRRTFERAEVKGNASPFIPVADSMRTGTPEDNKAVDRSKFLIIQTPQTFQSTLLKKAFELDYSPLFTDDASVLEAAGHAIHLVDGNRSNIKITTPDDFRLAEMYLAAAQA